MNILSTANNNYVFGSNAKKIEYDVYENNKVLKRKKRKRIRTKNRIKFFLFLVSIFFMGYLTISQYFVIAELNYKINQDKNNKAKLMNENALLKVEIDKATDYNIIKEIAEKELGMQKPDKAQKIYVKIPKDEYIMVYDKENEKTSTSFIDIAGKLLEFLH